MTGAFISQIALQLETDTFSQVIENNQLSWDLTNDITFNNTETVLAIANTTTNNTGSIYTLNSILQFVYIRASGLMQLTLTSTNLTGTIVVDRLFFLPAPLTNLVVTNTNTTNTLQILVISA